MFFRKKKGGLCGREGKICGNPVPGILGRKNQKTNSMTHSEAINRKNELLKEIERLDSVINSRPSPEERFWGLVKGCEIMPPHKDYPNSVFLFKNGECWFEYDTKNKNLYCRWEYVWRVFEDDYGMKYGEIKSFIKTQVEQAYKLGGVTPYRAHGRFRYMAEQAYKLNQNK